MDNRCPHAAHYTLQMKSGQPHTGPRWPIITPGWPTIVPRWVKACSTRDHDSPKMAQHNPQAKPREPRDEPRQPPQWTKRVLRLPNLALRWPKRVPRSEPRLMFKSVLGKSWTLLGPSRGIFAWSRAILRPCRGDLGAIPWQDRPKTDPRQTKTAQRQAHQPEPATCWAQAKEGPASSYLGFVPSSWWAKRSCWQLQNNWWMRGSRGFFRGRGPDRPMALISCFQTPALQTQRLGTMVPSSCVRGVFASPYEPRHAPRWTTVVPMLPTIPSRWSQGSPTLDQDGPS